MAGIEFVGAGPDDPFDDGDEDLPGDAGPRRPWPRWVWALAGLLVVAVAAGVLVSARSDSGPSATRSSEPAVPSATPTGSVQPGPTAVTPTSQIAALTSDGTSLYWLAHGRLFRAGPVGRVSANAVVLPADVDPGELQLVVDRESRVIWVVSRASAAGASGVGEVTGYGTDDLAVVRRASVRAVIRGAAVLNGALVVLAGGRLLRLSSFSSVITPLAPVDRTAHGLVAAGGGLLFVEGGNGSAIGRWSPSGVGVPSVLETVDNVLAVAGSTVFVLGTTRDGQPELDTLSSPGRRWTSGRWPPGSTRRGNWWPPGGAR